jgi:hypothetical protein
MKVTGHIHEVTNLVQFAPSFLLNPKKPKAGTFKNASGIHIHLASILAGILPGNIVPSVSAETISASDGSFTLSISDSTLQHLTVNKQAYFVAFRKVGSISILGQTIPIFQPVYRSAPFDITKFKGGPVDLFFAPFDVPTDSGISQKQVDDQIKAAKSKFKDLDKLSATIQDGKVSVSGSGRGATIKFNIDLSPSTSFDLARFLTGKVKDMDIDLPGPDFIVGICVSKDDIEKSIEDGIAKLMKEVNAGIEKELIAEIAKGTGQSADTVKNIFKTTASVTFSKLNYPVVDHKVIKVPIVGSIKIDVLAVVPKLAVGFPRKIS